MVFEVRRFDGHVNFNHYAKLILLILANIFYVRARMDDKKFLSTVHKFGSHRFEKRKLNSSYQNYLI